jgi:DNA uptake protein ComE-like DNA-binding protein
MTQSSPPGGSQAKPGASSGGLATGARRKNGLRQLGWASMPVWSVGFLAFAPFLRLAIARRRKRDWAIFAGYLLAVVAEIAALSVAGQQDPGETLAGGYVLLLMGVAAVHAAIAFSDDPTAAAARTLPASSDQRNQAALATARGRMERRQEAREIARKDPVLARELRIGRPDLARDYDDGGLVDVNQVPAGFLQSQLGLSAAEATAVVAARAKIDRFTSPDEVTTYAQLPPDRLDDVRDWMIFG